GVIVCRVHNQAQSKLAALRPQRKDKSSLAREAICLKMPRPRGGRERHECPDCHQSFATSTILKRHLPVHTEGDALQCKLCDRKFTQSYYLKNHLLSHTGEEPFKCTECQKTFMYESSLKRHFRIHTGERTYECADCHETFRYRDNLMRHRRSHHGGEKLSECKVCLKRFSSKSKYEIHVRMHEGQLKQVTEATGYQFSSNPKAEPNDAAILKCPACGKYLSSHSVVCCVCEKTFSHLSYLRTHIERQLEGGAKCSE
ncbi:Zinc finger protein 555, partial [Frankliniella fusca]